MQPVFESWTAEERTAWGSRPCVLRHRLHEQPLFSLDGLAALIDAYPKEHYSLIHMGAQGGRRFWREGELGDINGRETIDAIAGGRMWLNLRRVMLVDPRYRAVLEGIFAELDGYLPGLGAFEPSIGILISSPNAQVYYHADLPGQALWQVHGRKRLYVYPVEPPFLAPEQLEDIALYGIEVDMAYEPGFDEGAFVHELVPGEMAHWPLNAPHRIENLDCLNVSMTMEYWTDDIRRRHMLNVANGILRRHMHVAPRSRATSGPAFLAKAALQAGARRSGWLDGLRAKRRLIEFRLDRGALVPASGEKAA
ncbi:MAG: hypothetical protein KDG89_11070 [Geminicoccaceae bacterium]|nr:hypothetical protein [Geminicoccaceae bacterium]